MEALVDDEVYVLFEFSVRCIRISAVCSFLYKQVLFYKERMGPDVKVLAKHLFRFLTTLLACPKNPPLASGKGCLGELLEMLLKYDEEVRNFGLS